MTVWTGTPPNLLAGDIPSAADWQQMRDALKALSDPWTDYSSSLAWTATTTNPVLGNGTKSAKYWQAGKTVMYAGIITPGSTTTFGSGSYLISVPAALAATDTTTGVLYCSDASTPANRIVGVVTGASASTLALNVVGNVTPTSPFTWATSDSFRWAIMYEAG